jgi:microcystin-dependent protein
MTELVSNGVRFPSNLTQDSAFPQGMILMWSGAIVNIPNGYQLCNGSNGTPDLRNRFVVGAGDSYAVGATGGSNSVTLTENELPLHTHGVTDSTVNTSGSHDHSNLNTGTEPNHTHPSDSLIRTPGSIASTGSGATFGTTSSTGSGGSHSHSASTNSNGSHLHNVSFEVSQTGSGQSHENRPPYYALAFIMKVAA